MRLSRPHCGFGYLLGTFALIISHSLQAQEFEAFGPETNTAQPEVQAEAEPQQQARGSFTTTGIERAEGERLATAIGYYSRSRALLLEAIRAFDEGRKYASPDVLIDSEEWRATLVGRAEELERVMSPQPRASSTGVKFPSASQLLNTNHREDDF